jgi:hypothetical protein
MATQNFQIFDESLTSIDTDAEYLAEGQRLNGVTPGLASPKLHNKLYRQCSVMAYAIASVLAARGFNAMDDDPATLVDSIQRAFAFKVNGAQPDGHGYITSVRPIDAWPVGSLFMTFDNTNPAKLLGGGTWVQIKGKYLLAADTGNTVDGTSGVGAHTKNVPLVAHTHSFTTGSAGDHTHYVSGTTGDAGSHSHTGTTSWGGEHTHTFTYPNRVNPDHAITGGSAGHNETWNTSSAGGHTHSFTTSAVGNHTHGFSAGTNSTGAHTHTGTTASVGGSASFDVRPASIYVYMWRRTA